MVTNKQIGKGFMITGVIFLLIGLFQVYVYMTAFFMDGYCYNTVVNETIVSHCPPPRTAWGDFIIGVGSNSFYFIVAIVLLLVGIIIYKTEKGRKSVWKKIYDSV